MVEHLKANKVDVERTGGRFGPQLTIDPKTEKFTGTASGRDEGQRDALPRVPQGLRDQGDGVVGPGRGPTVDRAARRSGPVAHPLR